MREGYRLVCRLFTGVVLSGLICGSVVGDGRPETAGPQRVLHFPGDRSVGRVKLWPLPLDGELPVDRGRADISDAISDAEFAGLAQGDVAVPADRGVVLSLSYTYARDLSCLSTLGPDDLFMLRISSGERFPAPESHVYEQVKHLRGLRILSVIGMGVTGKGLHLLAGLRSLRGLELRAGARPVPTDLADLPELPCVEWCKCHIGVTDTALKNLARLRNLRVLRLEVDHLRGPGLADLAKLPHLEQLCLVGQRGPNDEQVRCLEGLTQLKRLTLWAGPGLTNRSLEVIGKLVGLEELTFIRISGLDDNGAEYLRGLQKLKSIEFRGSFGDKAIRVLSGLPQLEAIVHVSPSPEGMALLGRCRKLKTLDITFPPVHSDSRAASGFEHLAALTSLEDLSVNGNQIYDSDIKYLEGLPNLKRLSIVGPNLTNAGLASLARLQGLESLSLYAVPATKSGMNQLNSLTNLKALWAKGHPTMPWGDDAVLALDGLRNLETLSLLHCRFSLQDADLVFLPALTRLKRLDLAVWSAASALDAGTPAATGSPRKDSAAFGGPASAEALKYFGGLTGLEHLRTPILRLTGDDDLQPLVGLRNLKSLSLRGRVPEAVLYGLHRLPLSIGVLTIETTEPIGAKAIYDLRRSVPYVTFLKVRPIQPDGRPISRPAQRRR